MEHHSTHCYDQGISLFNNLKTQYTSNSKTNLTTITQRYTFQPPQKITFTYYNPMIRKIANIFKSTNIQITFHTNNTLHDILKTRSSNTSTYMRIGIYQLQCHTCYVLYIGQTDQRLEQSYKEQARYINSNNPNQHLHYRFSTTNTITDL